MPSIKLNVFGGIKTAVSSRLAQAQQARVAHNVRLRDGALRAMRAPAERTPSMAVGDSVCEIATHQHGECCASTPITLDTRASVIRPPDPGSCATFDWLAVFPRNGAGYRLNTCTGGTCPITVPAPIRRPAATRATTGTLAGTDPCCFSQSPDHRTYTYTWVDKFGIESPPAPPSEGAESWDDEVWSISSFDTPPPNAVCLRLYRATYTLVENPEADDLTPQSSSFQLVGEYPVPVAATIIDDKRLADLTFGTLMTEQECPHSPMEQVVLTENGYAVGFAGNRLFMSERHEVHNWPVKHNVVLPDRIVAIAAFYDTVFIATTGRPYRATVNVSERGGQVEAYINPIPFTENFPCVGRDTMTATSFGAMYNSTRGLIALAATGLARIITRDRIDEADWVNYRPNVGAFHDGKYFGTTATGRGFILDIAEEAEGSLDVGDFVTVDMHADRIHSGFDGRLWLAHDGRVYEWEGSHELMPYVWESRIIPSDASTTFNVGRVTADYGPSVEITVLTDSRVFDELDVCSGAPFRLCANGRGREWSVRIKGTTTVHQVVLSSSRMELAET